MATQQNELTQVHETDLGLVKLTLTEAGVRGLVFVSDDEQLKTSNERADCWPEIERIIAGQSPQSSVPLDLRGTPFQQSVWATLQIIPHGQTRTYSQVAELMGRPTAVRAVAKACADNPVSLLVPCHRVIGKSGTLTGYRWGIERKRELLKRESALA